jgi:hypothetical protein
MRSLRLGRRVVMLVPLAALLLGLVSTTVIHAASRPVSQPASFTSEPTTYRSTYLYFPLLNSREVFGSPTRYAAIDEASFSMAPGEIRRVTDQLDIRVNTGNNPEVDNKVICLDQKSNIIGPPGTQPVPYSNAAYAVDGTGTGTNYIANGHAYQWNVATLIEAPPQDPAENYFCLLLARIDPPYQMTVLAPTKGETTYGTWLEVSNQNEVGAQEMQTPYCATNGRGQYSECSYVGGPARLHNPTAEDVSWQPVDVWTAAPDATTVDGIATFQITSCPHGTGSCPPSEWGYSNGLRCFLGIRECKNADGESYLDIDQLYPDGSVCHFNRTYSEKSTGGRVFLSKSYDISNAQHHLPLYYHISAPVQTCAGSRLFKVVLYIRWTNGNPVKIDGGNVNLLNRVSSSVYPVDRRQ